VVISKRERYIAIGAVAAAVLLGLDSYVLTPYFDQRSAIASEREQTIRRLSEADSLFGRQRRLQGIWTDIQRGGLKGNPSQAESQALQAVLDWAKASGVELAALKPERTTQEGKFQVISFSVTGTGSMAAVSRLLWSLESATIPVRVNDMQITPRKEATDDLSVRLSVSTLCMPPDSDAKPDRNAAAETSARGDRS
jgi:hypothetical protein